MCNEMSERQKSLVKHSSTLDMFIQTHKGGKYKKKLHLITSKILHGNRDICCTVYMNAMLLNISTEKVQRLRSLIEVTLLINI